MTKMSEEAKARLREIAAAKRGRTTLSGYDAFGWAACLDEVVSGGIPMPPRSQYSDGIVGPHEGKVRTHNGFGDCFVKSYWWSRKQREKKESVRYAKWARFGNMRDGQDDDLARCFPHQWVWVDSYVGPGKPIEKKKVRVYPADKLLLLLVALWPDTYAEAAKKYMSCYSDGFVLENQVKES